MTTALATQVEDWLVAKIRTIADGIGPTLFASSDVEPWDGTLTPGAGWQQRLIDEMFSGTRDRVCRVLFEGDSVQPLEVGEIEVKPRFLILVGIKNRRPADARRGDDTWIGTSRLRDLMRRSIHRQRPLDLEGALLGDGVDVVNDLYWLGSTVLINTATHCVVQMVVEARETLKK